MTKATIKGGAALVLVDFINDMRFEGAEQLFDAGYRAAGVTAKLRAQADALDVPVIYVNDNYGHWHSEKDEIVERCLAPASPGRPIVRRGRSP